MEIFNSSVLSSLVFIASFAAAQSAFALGSVCIGDPTAPVKMVYLHGQFEPGTRGTNFYEKANLKQLEAMAKKLGIRIAAPLGHSTSNFTQWGGESLNQIKSKAKNACGTLDTPVTLLGFSNGANQLNQLLGSQCFNKDIFDQVLVSGYSGRKKIPLKCNKDIVHSDKTHLRDSISLSSIRRWAPSILDLSAPTATRAPSDPFGSGVQ